MRILLAEDRPELNETYSIIIENYNREYNKRIELISVNSIEELRLRILTERIDGAIVDNNLEGWGDPTSKSLSEAGFEICSSISKFSNFNDFSSQVILYSSLTMKFKNTEFKTIDKFVGNNALNDFETKILEPLSNSIDMREITFDRFCNYSISEKISYYKRYVLDKINPEQRFKKFAPSVSWSSDLVNENCETIIGTLFKDSGENLPNAVNTLYSELDKVVSSAKKIPTLLWNFIELDNFQYQDSQIVQSRFVNKFIRIFYSVAFAKSMARHILNKYDIIDILPSLVSDNDTVILREIQCEIITKLHEQNDMKTKGKECLKAIQEKLDYEIVDYFKCNLESFDEETDSARVQLTSMTDPQKYFYQEFSYKRLRENGIRYKEAEFNYCVSEFQNSISSYIETK